MADFKIHLGHVLTVLRSMPADSVHCVVTSIPYWGLRSYGTEPQVWGGDSGCDHVWGLEQLRGGPAGKQGSTSQREGRANVEAQESASKSVGSWCQLCGAWRGELGLEPTPELFVEHVVEVFREVRRVLRDDGTLWLNIGDSYCSDAGADRAPTTLAGPRVPSGWTNRAQPQRVHAVRKGPDRDPKRGAAADGAPIQAVRTQGTLKPKDLCMMPARVALALQADGWYLRCDVIWNKANPMPESVRDRPTKSHEYIFMLSKSPRYYYDAEAIKEPASGTAHNRASARKMRAAEGQKSLPTGERNGMRGQKFPSGWSAEPGRHDTVGSGRYAPGVTPKAADPGPGIRNNTSFSAAVVGIVDERNKRSVWTVATEPFSAAHFATYPTALIEPCILAGTSAVGCCPTCGAPYERDILEPDFSQQPKRSSARDEGQQLSVGAGYRTSAGQAWQDWRAANPNVTIAWKPGCSCEVQAPPVPAVVLDPFTGSGTTGIVALRNGRNFLGIELQPKYHRMAYRRILRAVPLAARATDAPAVIDEPHHDLPLFQEAPHGD